MGSAVENRADPEPSATQPDPQDVAGFLPPHSGSAAALCLGTQSSSKASRRARAFNSEMQRLIFTLWDKIDPKNQETSRSCQLNTSHFEDCFELY